ncbi:MAG: sugar transferase [Candidatus Eremiobacteraeota bacterium]|nr:sugar transferase [Candidatus Eremiobacteraeota bacterium]
MSTSELSPQLAPELPAPPQIAPELSPDVAPPIIVRPDGDNRPFRTAPRSWHVAKRGMDVVLGGAVLVGLAPLIAVASAAIAIVSRGSPFFWQERVGENGRRFRMWKLRTMVDGAHLEHGEMLQFNEVDGPVLKIRNDPRLHRLGKFLRRTSIDELPNLFNVVRGDMSLVGPRPPLPSEVDHYDSFARRRLLVKPGITCLWQISGRSSLSFETWMRLDNRYIETWSPLGDLAILLKTLPAVIGGKGAH